MPRFCIVIPCHESAPTLGVAIDSALAQRHQDFAVVVSDNASRDGTRELVAARKDPRLRAECHAVRLPKSANWNRAYRLASDCEYLVTLHSDDLLRPDCLNIIEREVRRTGAEIVHGAFTPLSYDGNAVRPRRGFPFPHTASGELQQEILLLGNIVSVVGVAIRRDVFERVGGWPERFTYMQDTEFWFRAAATARFRYTPAVFGHYRDLPPSAAGKWAAQLEEALSWYAECRERANSKRLRFAAELSIGKILEEIAVAEKNGREVPAALAVLRARMMGELGRGEWQKPDAKLARQRRLRAKAAMLSLFRASG